MRTFVRAALLCGIVAAGARPGMAAGAGNINLFGGVKNLDQDVWSPVESQPEYGVEITLGGTGWPVMLALDALQSSDEEDQEALTLKGTTTEVNVGIRKIWEKGRARPFIGGGVAWIDAETEAEAPPLPGTPGLNLFPEVEPGSSATESDSGTGLWGGAGVFWRLGSYFNLGISARFSGAKVTIRGDEEQAGGLHAGILLGFGWPAAAP